MDDECGKLPKEDRRIGFLTSSTVALGKRTDAKINRQYNTVR